MKPIKLTINGWGPYKEKAVIDFTRLEGRGLFLITGPTGAGKTTIFDALTYALYGSLSGDMREKSSVRSDFADGDTLTFVELVMSHGGREYRIYRNPEYYRPKKRKTGKDAYTKEKENAVLYLPDENVLEGTGQVNARIQEILVLDYNQFRQISMIAQGEFAKLLTASPRDKIKIFREIFGTGIYEQFASNLRRRASALYDRVTEQRHKIEEDIRLLVQGLEKAAEQGVDTDKLLSLTDSDNLNYTAILESIEELQKQVKSLLVDKNAEYARLDKETHSLTGKVTAKKQENARIEELQEAGRKLEELKARKQEMAQAQKEWKRAQNAGFVQRYQVQAAEAADGLARMEETLAALAKEKTVLAKEQQGLKAVYKNRELIGQYIELLEKWQTAQETAQAYRKQCSLKEKARDQARAGYLEAERVRDERRFRYEEADRAYKRAAVGIAARMLREGEPCPVCGSREHPLPASVEDGVLSEEELQELKGSYEEAESSLLEWHGKAAGLRAEAEEQLARVQAAQTDADTLQEKKGKLMDKLEARGLARMGEETTMREIASARGRLQQELTRYGQLDSLLHSNEVQRSGAVQDKKSWQEKRKLAETALKEACREYGFGSVADYLKAGRTMEERLRLEGELAAYRQELSGAEKLYLHLKEEVGGRQKSDIEMFSQALLEKKAAKDDARVRQEKLHALNADAVRTARILKEKLADVEEAGREYGYVKDLDNMASGNNSRRLVFEQYVLAGYFEEILRAANMRFLKMTGGRYEMSRMAQVSDGRVKDALEIEVMDYYTGKLRPVRTLSGGEAFKASLSLALGLSDVIQAMNGGIRVDALFVDEGFGSLDSESLDQACEALQGLVESNRLIGIISHVPELRERIDAQLIVDKTNCGSMVRIMV